MLTNQIPALPISHNIIAIVCHKTRTKDLVKVYWTLFPISLGVSPFPDYFPMHGGLGSRNETKREIQIICTWTHVILLVLITGTLIRMTMLLKDGPPWTVVSLPSLHIYLMCIITTCTPDYCTYNVSKIGLNRLTELQAKALSSDASRPGILVNSVSTNMSSI